MGRVFKDRRLERQTEEWNTANETMLAVHSAPLHRAVYMFAALTSISVWQMYIVAAVTSSGLAVITTRWFWKSVIPVIAPMLLATGAIIIMSTLVINRCDRWLPTGRHLVSHVWHGTIITITYRIPRYAIHI
jgi:hypothetical protein